MDILIADDDFVTRIQLARIAQRLGHTVRVAEDGLDAWAQFEAAPPDVLVTDWMMPGMDGPELCQRIRQTGRSGNSNYLPRRAAAASDLAHPYTYVVMVTAHCEATHGLQGMQSGADDFLIKPVDALQLEARLIAAERITSLHRHLVHQAARHAEVSEALQRSLLLLPPEGAFPGLALESVYEAASEETLLGGDVADVFALGEGRVALIVADVMGKGLAAASFTAEIKFALRAYLREHDCTTALVRLNHFLCRGAQLRSPTDHFPISYQGSFYPLIALTLAVVDTRAGEVTCYAAGAEPPLLLRRNEESGGSSGADLEWTKAEGPLLGLEEDPEFIPATLPMAVGDLLVMTTDGVLEARHPGFTPFGLEGLAEAARYGFERRLPLETCGQHIFCQSLAHAGGKQLDDVCLLLAQRTATES